MNNTVGIMRLVRTLSRTNNPAALSEYTKDLSDDGRKELVRRMRRYQGATSTQEAYNLKQHIATLTAPAPPEPTGEDLAGLKVTELRKIAKDLKIEGVSSLKKAELIEAIENERKS